MHIQGDKLIMDVVSCWHCDGAGEYERGISCPNYWQPVRGKHPGNKCPHCGAKNKHSHKPVGSKIVRCDTCGGKGERLEDRYNYMPNEIWRSFDFKVYRDKRPTSWNEQYLGIGTVYSCMDYGAHATMSDAELIADVRDKDGRHQACKVTKEDGTLANHIGIFTSRGGYSVVPVFDDAKKAAVALQKVNAGVAIETALKAEAGRGNLTAMGIILGASR